MRALELSDKNAVLRALQECDALGRKRFLKKYGFLPSRWYVLLHNGKLYDSKAIFAVAYGYQYGKPLKAAEFSGGLGRVRPVLENLGFKVRGMEGGEEFDLLPDEVSVELWEGARRTVEVNIFERSLEARRACIAHHGAKCCVCEFDFGEVYGDEFAGFIQVHHITPLSGIDARYKVDPILHLVPVCANCHAIIHHGGVTRSIDEVRKLLHAKTTNR